MLFQGLIYFDVPIAEDDAVIVPPLEGFVMNRTLGDYFETLLYKVYIVVQSMICKRNKPKKLIDLKSLRVQTLAVMNKLPLAANKKIKGLFVSDNTCCCCDWCECGCCCCLRG